MRQWAHYVLYAIFAGAVISWFAIIMPWINVAVELRRARSGEADEIPPGYGGLPFAVLFMKNILPRVEKDRRRLAMAIGAFLGFLALGVVLVILLGPVK